MKRVIIVDSEANGKGKVGSIKEYINPEIIEVSGEEEEWYEGCFSTGNVTGIVSSPKFVTVKSLDREGKEKIEQHAGYIARIFRHEIDHLNGLRFPNRVKHEENLHFVEPHEFPQYRNQQGWRTWEKKCSWAEWEEISNPDKPS
jgi:peptide deformylase